MDVCLLLLWYSLVQSDLHFSSTCPSQLRCYTVGTWFLLIVVSFIFCWMGPELHRFSEFLKNQLPNRSKVVGNRRIGQKVIANTNTTYPPQVLFAESLPHFEDRLLMRVVTIPFSSFKISSVILSSRYKLCFTRECYRGRTTFLYVSTSYRRHQDFTSFVFLVSYIKGSQINLNRLI